MTPTSISVTRTLAVEIAHAPPSSIVAPELLPELPPLLLEPLLAPLDPLALVPEVLPPPEPFELAPLPELPLRIAAPDPPSCSPASLEPLLPPVPLSPSFVAVLFVVAHATVATVLASHSPPARRARELAAGRRNLLAWFMITPVVMGSLFTRGAEDSHPHG